MTSTVMMAVIGRLLWFGRCWGAQAEYKIAMGSGNPSTLCIKIFRDYAAAIQAGIECARRVPGYEAGIFINGQPGRIGESRPASKFRNIGQAIFDSVTVCVRDRRVQRPVIQNIAAFIFLRHLHIDREIDFRGHITPGQICGCLQRPLRIGIIKQVGNAITAIEHQRIGSDQTQIPNFERLCSDGIVGVSGSLCATYERGVIGEWSDREHRLYGKLDVFYKITAPIRCDGYGNVIGLSIAIHIRWKPGNLTATKMGSQSRLTDQNSSGQSGNTSRQFIHLF